jgi:hypothetical protein
LTDCLPKWELTFTTYKIRQRLISSYTEDGFIPTEIDDMREDYAAPYFYGYSRVCITALGVSFVKACTITD